MMAVLAVGLFSACEDVEVLQPHAAVSVEGDQYVYDINETMEVHFIGQAENVVIYTGDSTHNYELRDQSNYGLVVNKGLFTYSYQTPGNYKVVCVATNHGDAGSIIKTDTCSFMVRVVDDDTTIERLSAPRVIYDEVFADALNDTDWLLSLPRKILYNGADRNLSLNQRLKFYINSSSTSVFIDGEAFSETANYDLEQVLDITVRSYEGTERPYRLYTLNYGEFETFEMLGVAATLTRSEFDYSTIEINLEVPAGSDLSAVAPTFTLYENTKVYVGDAEQVSGTTTHDFTQPVTYRFVASHPDNPDITIESTCVVTVTVAAE